MKGAWVKTTGIIVAIIAVTGLLAAVSPDNQGAFDTAQNDSAAPGSARDGSRATTAISDTYNVVDACTILTASDVASVLGSVEASPGNNQLSPMVNGIKVTNCGYAHGTENVNDIITASLMVRAAVNHDGAVANENEFSMLRASGGQEVQGYGDAAFWDQNRSQLYIKADNNWYSISIVKGSHTGSGALEQNKAIADRIKSKL